MIVVMGAGSVMTTWMSVAAAVTGSLLAMALVLAVSRRVRSRGTLIVAGVMIGYICSAATNFLIAFADDQSIVNLHNWSLGSFSGTSWTDIVAIAPTVAITAVATFVLSKPLGAYQLGEDYAHSVGVNIRAFRSAIVMLSSIMSACTVAFAGPISFVGIAAPISPSRRSAPRSPSPWSPPPSLWAPCSAALATLSRACSSPQSSSA